MPVIRDGEEVHAYYPGWTRCESVPFNVAIGCAIRDGGATFTKMGNGPVLGYSPDEPFVVSGTKIRRFDGVWHMCYVVGRMEARRRQVRPLEALAIEDSCELIA